MNKLFFKKTFIYFGIFLFIFLADRISKLYILSVLEDLGFVDININSYINLILVWNSGIAFGPLSFDQSEMYNLMTILITFINLFIIYLRLKIKSSLYVIRILKMHILVIILLLKVLNLQKMNY